MAVNFRGGSGIFFLCLIALSLAACANSKPVLITGSTPKGSTLSPPLERIDWWTKLHWPTENCPVTSPTPDNEGIEAYPLDDGRSLVEVICSLGAYQGSSRLYLLDTSSTAHALNFRQFQAPDVGKLEPYDDKLVTGLMQVRPQLGEITVWRKYRGIGDCGQFLRYHLTGNQLHLKELRMQECEDEPNFLPPEQWRKINTHLRY